jgi:hypothetical protein
MAPVADSVDFAEFEDDFLRVTRETVFCSVTTVDDAKRPRSRMLHPIFVVLDGRPLVWALTGRTPLKTGHLKANPHLSRAYPVFTPPRLEPWRVHVMTGDNYPRGELIGRVWRA